MKKIFKPIIYCISALFICTSCVTAYASTQTDDIYTVTTQTDEISVSTNITYSTIIRYGTPFYIDGVISYYTYNNIYYYPYIWNNIWYFRPFRCIQPHGFIYRPYRYHRPYIHLGDIHHRHNITYGPHHIDHYKRYYSPSMHHSSPVIQRHYQPINSSTRITVNQQRVTPNKSQNMQHTTPRPSINNHQKPGNVSSGRFMNQRQMTRPSGMQSHRR